MNETQAIIDSHAAAVPANNEEILRAWLEPHFGGMLHELCGECGAPVDRHKYVQFQFMAPTQFKES